MARRWRIRHKLTLGLVLVVGIMGILVAGTLDGMLTYRATMKAIKCKVEELESAQGVQEEIQKLKPSGKDQPFALNMPELMQKIPSVQRALDSYERTLNITVGRGFDPDNGHEEKSWLELMRKDLRELYALASIEEQPEIIGGPIESDSSNKVIRDRLDALKERVIRLQGVIRADIKHQMKSANEDEAFTLGLVCGTSALGALLMLVLARQAYRWLVDPIRELHDKVGRLAEGNFDSRIEVQSGDEIQDLAAAFNDMTERLQNIYRDLEKQVNDRSKQLVRSERLAGVGFLAAGVAHEINNPLASIAFCGEALERRLRELLANKRDHPDMATVNNYLKMIQDEAFRCKEITQKLLEFSRIGERQRQPTDMADLIQTVIDIVGLHQNYRGKRVVFAPNEHPTLLINDQEIKSVVLNLVANALDSMDEGGTLTIDLETRKDMAVMTFSDTGCGMSPEVLENLFEPFFSRSRTGKGIGLGLSISHRIITQHGGDIEVTSPGPNLGSTFTVRLPLTAAAVETQTLARAA